MELDGQKRAEREKIRLPIADQLRLRIQLANQGYLRLSYRFASLLEGIPSRSE